MTGIQFTSKAAHYEAEVPGTYDKRITFGVRVDVTGLDYQQLHTARRALPDTATVAVFGDDTHNPGVMKMTAYVQSAEDAARYLSQLETSGLAVANAQQARLELSAEAKKLAGGQAIQP